MLSIDGIVTRGQIQTSNFERGALIVIGNRESDVSEVQ